MVDVGPPVSISAYYLPDERGFELYDAKGLCCGTVALEPDGSLTAILKFGDVHMKCSQSIKDMEVRIDPSKP